MVLAALLLMAVGLTVSLFGFKLFRVLLPVVGLVSGTLIGFTGFQGIFGKGTVSTTVAVFVAISVGLVLALLSFAFFEIAVVVLTAIVGASLFAYLGIALGLGADGFIVFMLSIAGFVMGLAVASSGPIGASLILTLTAMAGVAFMLSGIFLIAGDVTLNQLQNEGVISSVLKVVDQSFLWLFVWLAGSIVARQVQLGLVMTEIFDDSYQFKETTTRK